MIVPLRTKSTRPSAFTRSIHLLYVPTLACNLSCTYCYLGAQTTQAALRTDAARAVSTLRHALGALKEAGVLAFNVSLHGGEVTTLPHAVLDELFTIIRDHYLAHFDDLTALGHRKSAPHVKTNLYDFASLYDLFDRHKVSVSASIDLPLRLHAEHRRTRGGKEWIEKTHEHLRLLGRYPHARKISATLSAEHLADVPAIIEDIWFIHRELGFDMNQLNFMFAFASELNRANKGEAVLTPAAPDQQLAFYEAVTAAFTGTELEEGLRRHWFDEFKPTYCTNAYNCGERFYLLQGDGSVYSCVRGQGIEEFRYGNVFEDRIEDILQAGARRIAEVHQRHGFEEDCRSCDQLARCHTGCPVVKHQQRRGRSYTCALQKRIYADNPRSYPPAPPAAQARDAESYARGMHPDLAFRGPAPERPSEAVVLPTDLYEERNALRPLVEADPVLRELYSSDAFRLELDGEVVALESQILKSRATVHVLQKGDRVRLHVRRSLFDANCSERIRNTLHLQLLRDTPVVYGDERRAKQEHLFTYQLFLNCLEESPLYGAEWLVADLAGLLELHAGLYRRGVRNNLFVTTSDLRDYHYQKQKNNAFYHLQAMNLPFQNFEFHYLPEAHP